MHCPNSRLRILALFILTAAITGLTLISNELYNWCNTLPQPAVPFPHSDRPLFHFADDGFDAGPNAIRLSGLQLHDRLEVEFASKGCFHEWSYDMIFAMTDAGTVELELRNNNGDVLANRVLSPTDVRYVDNVFNYYRQSHQGLCTTEDFIHARLYADGTLVREKWHDATCGVRDYDNLFDFNDFIWQADRH